MQSNYIPWRGYFDLIASVDTFVLFDTAQYSKGSWRNRNRIKTPVGAQWLTVPVSTQQPPQSILDTNIAGSHWARNHIRTLTTNYAAAPYFSEVSKLLSPAYDERTPNSLSALNRMLIEIVCRYLHIHTEIVCSSTLEHTAGKSEKLAHFVKQLNGTSYISGPAAKSYLDESVFSAQNIKVEWFNYGPQRPYPQLWGNFSPNLSILDLLFNCGTSSPEYMNLTNQL